MDLEGCASFLSRFLATATEFQRRPHRLLHAYNAARQQDSSNTDRVLLDTCYAAWLGYFLASNAIQGQANYKGKAADRGMLDNLSQQSLNELRQIARRLDEEARPDILRATIERWERSCRGIYNASISISCFLTYS
jgi:hypothetical protein